MRGYKTAFFHQRFEDYRQKKYLYIWMEKPLSWEDIRFAHIL